MTSTPESSSKSERLFVSRASRHPMIEPTEKERGLAREITFIVVALALAGALWLLIGRL